MEDQAFFDDFSSMSEISELMDQTLKERREIQSSLKAKLECQLSQLKQKLNTNE